ncbi:MAG: beta-ketoacyl synthase chain length factor [Deltaproteobacteria bacterium]|nr:beta-ketoacyl synthase chain length factor [Deltaproteobacteria bacterium]
MSAHIAGTAYRVPGSGPLLDDLLASRPRSAGRFLACDEPIRPEVIGAGAWRRMSRLGRLVTQVSAPLLAGRVDLDTLAVVWGTVFGELGPTGRFLDRLFTEGVASPLAFQNSVYNAPVGHLSNALDLRGMSETLSAGGALFRAGGRRRRALSGRSTLLGPARGRGTPRRGGRRGAPPRRRGAGGVRRDPSAR